MTDQTKDGQAALNEEEEYEALFNELADKDTSLDDALDQETQEQPQGEGSEEQASDKSEAQAQTQDGKVPPEKGAEDDKEAATKASKAETSEDDWRASLPEQATKALEQYATDKRLFEHKTRSFNGRVAGLNRKIKELQEQLEQQKQQQEEAELAVQQKADEIKVPDIQDAEAFGEFAKTYPQIAEAVRAQVKAGVEAAISHSPASAQSASPATQPAEQQANDELSPEEIKYLNEQHAILVQRVPNYQTIADTPFFQEFLDQLPPKVAALAQSDDAEDLIHLFVNEYGPYYRRFYPAAATAGAMQPNTTSSNSSQNAQNVQQRRKRELDNTSVSSRTPRPSLEGTADLSSPEAYEAFFNKLAEKEQRARTA